MPELIKISLYEAKQMKKKVPREAKRLNEYIGYINALAHGEAGKFELLNKQQYYTYRAGLLRAAKSIGIILTVKKIANELVFWKENIRKRKAQSKVL